MLGHGNNDGTQKAIILSIEKERSTFALVNHSHNANAALSW